MKITILAACALLTSVVAASAQQQGAPSSYQPSNPNMPTVLTHDQSVDATKAVIKRSTEAQIFSLEKAFENVSNIITANPLHLGTADDVMTALGADEAAKLKATGALLLSTVIKANRIDARTDTWVAQAWVQAWIASYKLDPATGDPLPQ